MERTVLEQYTKNGNRFSFYDNSSDKQLKSVVFFKTGALNIKILCYNYKWSDMKNLPTFFIKVLQGWGVIIFGERNNRCHTKR
jgi:hypothetical protein